MDIWIDSTFGLYYEWCCYDNHIFSWILHIYIYMQKYAFCVCEGVEFLGHGLCIYSALVDTAKLSIH